MPVSSRPRTGVERAVLDVDGRQPDRLAVRERHVDGGVVGARARAERLEPRVAYVQRRRPVGAHVAVERLHLGLPERVVGEPHVAFVDAHQIDVHASGSAAAARAVAAGASRAACRGSTRRCRHPTRRARRRCAADRAPSSSHLHAPDNSDPSATVARSPGITTGGAAPAPSTTSPRSSMVPKPTFTSLTVTARPMARRHFGQHAATRIRYCRSPAARRRRSPSPREAPRPAADAHASTDQH